MVDVSNNVNSKIAKPDIGVLAVPDVTYKPRIFNRIEARKNFNKIDKDIYEEKEKISYEETVKTPKGIIAIVTIAALTILASFAKKYFKRKP